MPVFSGCRFSLDDRLYALQAAMHAYGLLFYDGGQWKMVATIIGAN